MRTPLALCLALFKKNGDSSPLSQQYITPNWYQTTLSNALVGSNLLFVEVVCRLSTNVAACRRVGEFINTLRHTEYAKRVTDAPQAEVTRPHLNI